MHAVRGHFERLCPADIKAQAEEAVRAAAEAEVAHLRNKLGDIKSGMQSLLPRQWQQDGPALLKELREKVTERAKTAHVPPKRDTPPGGSPEKKTVKNVAGAGGGNAGAATNQ